jgi:hypothetical protein
MSDEPAKSKMAWRIACVAALIFLGVLITEVMVWAHMAGSPEADVDSKHQKMLVPIVPPHGKAVTSGDTW